MNWKRYRGKRGVSESGSEGARAEPGTREEGKDVKLTDEDLRANRYPHSQKEG